MQIDKFQPNKYKDEIQQKEVRDMEEHFLNGEDIVTKTLVPAILKTKKKYKNHL